MRLFVSAILAAAASAALPLSARDPRFPPALATLQIAAEPRVALLAETQKPQQAAPRDAKASTPGAGIIRGRVVSADTRDPLRRARLQLAAPELEKARVAAADAQGRFEFTGLPPGRYTMTASKTGYVTLQYGQRRVFEAGTPIELADKQVLEAIEVALPRGGVITGHIIDDTGEPMAGASVAAMRPRYTESGRQLVRIGRAVETDDRGEYRLFDLAPGSYLVDASSSLGSSVRGDTLPFGSAYHPGTANPDQAGEVNVRVGQVRAGIDIALQPVLLATLSGVLMNVGRGIPVTGGSVGVYGAGGSVSISAAVRPDGTFTIAGVPPGEFSLVASGREPDVAGDLFGMLPLTVSGGDLVGLYIPLTPGGRATGQIVFEGTIRPPVSPAAITLFSRSASRVQYGGGPVGRIRGDWTFELTELLGPRLLSVSPVPRGWALKAVVLDGRDITDTPLTFTGTEELTGIRVVLTNRTTKISGRVADERGRDVRDCTIVVFPEDRARWTWRSRFIATARPGLDGRFTLGSLPPASYLIAAIESLEEGDAFDPEFLAWLSTRATRLTLDEGDLTTIELKLVRETG